MLGSAKTNLPLLTLTSWVKVASPFQEVDAARGFGFETSGHTWTINWGTISMWPWSREKGLERSGGSRDCNGFLATRTRRRLAARCRCTAAQLGELRQPDRCIFIWVQYIWYLIFDSNCSNICLIFNPDKKSPDLPFSTSKESLCIIFQVHCKLGPSLYRLKF